MSRRGDLSSSNNCHTRFPIPFILKVFRIPVFSEVKDGWAIANKESNRVVLAATCWLSSHTSGRLYSTTTETCGLVRSPRHEGLLKKGPIFWHTATSRIVNIVSWVRDSFWSELLWVSISTVLENAGLSKDSVIASSYFSVHEWI